MTQYKINVTGLVDEAHVQTFYNNLIFIPTFALFYSARTFFAYHRVAPCIKKAILVFGSCAFGIMLLEGSVRTMLRFIFIRLQPVIHTLPACTVLVLSTYLVGTLIVLCLKQLPFVRCLL